MTKTITLTEHQMACAAWIGVQRQICARKGKLKTRFVPSDWWGVHINGACGEMVVAMALNIFWDGRLYDGKQGGDVGPYQVRCTHHKRGRLTIHDNDKNDDIFILVTGDGITFDFDIVGWIKASDGKQRDYWERQPSGTWDFMVPQSVLKPFEELLKKEKEQRDESQSVAGDCNGGGTLRLL